MLMPQMHKKMMTATNLLSELAHALRRSIGDNGDQESSNQQNTNDPNTMEKTKEVSINMGFQSAVKKSGFHQYYIIVNFVIVLS